MISVFLMGCNTTNVSYMALYLHSICHPFLLFYVRHNIMGVLQADYNEIKDPAQQPD